MLRATLYRIVMAIALGASLVAALGVGAFGASYYRQVLNEERERGFADLQQRILFMDRVFSLPESAMFERGKTALLALDAKWKEMGEPPKAAEAELRSLAESLDVDEIYLIDARNVVVATSFGTDLGLDFSGFSREFTIFLEGVRGKGEVANERLSVSSRTGALNSYQYYSAPGSNWIIEISCGLGKAFPRAYSGMGYEEFMRLDFGPYLASSGAGPFVAFDVVNCSERQCWSTIKPGQKRVVDEAIINEAFSKGEAIRTAGGLRRFYRPVHDEYGGAAFLDRTLAEIVIDITPLRRFALLSFFIGLASCSAAGLLSLIAARSFLDRPIVSRVEALREAMDRAAGGEHGLSFDHEGEDEIAIIGGGLEAMLGEARAADEKLRNAKSAEAIGIMAGGLAHDINNLLTGAVGAATFLRTRLDEEGSLPPGEVRASLELIERTGERGNILVRDLLAIARADRPAPKPVDLAALVTETAQLLSASAPPDIVIDIALPAEPAIALASAEDLGRILLNLGKNGMQAMTDMRPPEEKRGGNLGFVLRKETIQAPDPSGRDGDDERASWPEKEEWVIDVRDSGVGISQETMSRLFSPFFTTKPHRGGSGLGLAASRAVAEAYGGQILVRSELGKGTIFSLVLPAAKGGGASMVADASEPRQEP